MLTKSEKNNFEEAVKAILKCEERAQRKTIPIYRNDGEEMIKIKSGHCKIIYIIGKKSGRKKKAVISNNNGTVEICGLDHYEILAEDVQDVTPDDCDSRIS